MEKITEDLIAPCGMNCGVCSGHLREKNRCSGCNNEPVLPYCQRCAIRLCTERKGRFCYDCEKFPCSRLKHLDKRYREKYGMSEIENLENIRSKGLCNFVIAERDRWQTDEGVFCVHNKKVY